MLEPETTFGAWLRYRRRLLDMTQTELAQRAMLSRRQVSRLERGLCRMRGTTRHRLIWTLHHHID